MVAGGMRTRRVDSNGLDLAVTEWGEPGLPGVLLLHGWLDHGRSFCAVAERLADRFHLVAPDLRGHGHSGWIGPGGYYHFFDYYLDATAVADALLAPPFFVVGHSMGASVAAGYAGTFPQKVRRVALLEGLGLPDQSPDDLPSRVASWIDTLQKRRQRAPQPMRDLDEAVARLQAVNARIPPDFARRIAAYGTRPVQGGLLWAHDPLHRTRSPKPFYLAEARAFWSRLPPPVLVVHGADSPFGLPDAEARLAMLPEARLVTLEGAGHNLHHDVPEALAEVLGEFMMGGPA